MVVVWGVCERGCESGSPGCPGGVSPWFWCRGGVFPWPGDAWFPWPGGGVKSLGLLVPVGFAGYPGSTSGLSTQWSAGGLTHTVGGGRSHLGEGFALRCFQRFSRPNVANQRCPWQDNWHTRGSSVPVLSY